MSVFGASAEMRGIEKFIGRTGSGQGLSAEIPVIACRQARWIVCGAS